MPTCPLMQNSFALRMHNVCLSSEYMPSEGPKTASWRVCISYIKNRSFVIKHQSLFHRYLIVSRHVTTSAPMVTCYKRDSIRWLYSCDKSSYIRSVDNKCHMDSLKCIEKIVNNQILTQVLQLYVRVSFCIKVIRSSLNIITGGHGHVIYMGAILLSNTVC